MRPRRWLPHLGKIVLFLWVLLGVLGLGRMGFDQLYDGPGPLETVKTVVIPPGALGTTARRLKADGVIVHPLLFEAVAWITRGKIPVRSGEFRIPAHESLRGVIHILRFAPEVEHQVTIPGGLTSPQIAALINKAEAATGSVPTPPEGAVLPQTYAYLRGTARTVILARMEKAMQAALAKAWTGRASGLPVQTETEAVTLASIVQQETPLRAELPMIAGVYENRLVVGMKLQADPTVIFAVTKGQATALPGPVTAADLAMQSPYNTYLHHGLPPGPICAPDLAAIEAVLHPAATEAFYFVATGKGGHVFADTFRQQVGNIKAYRSQKRSPIKKLAKVNSSARKFW